ncbi:MAG: type II toxin-antitoxin system VapC family toxin [Syntrophomonadaceae bacterium]|jgi:ribonuclease VapC|nr:type II toxin-antitoxin system VapC family toxin [Syntrophomonadaceae bacterium]
MRCGLNYIFDACALISLIKNEAAFDQVNGLLARAAAGEISIFMSIINLVEVYYGFLRDMGEQAADEIMSDAADLPITVIDTISGAVYREAARFKADYPMSLADAFLCACAKALHAVIVTKDDEIKAAERVEAGAPALTVFWLAK